MNPYDQKAILEAGGDIKARLRSSGIREFCERAGIPASVEALNLPDDVKIFRMMSAIESKEPSE